MLVGRKAPVFSASAVVNGTDFEDNFSLTQYIGKKLSNFIKKYFKNNVQSFIYSISNNKKTIELNAFI